MMIDDSGGWFWVWFFKKGTGYGGANLKKGTG